MMPDNWISNDESDFKYPHKYLKSIMKAKDGLNYSFDLRMIVSWSTDGWRLITGQTRRAHNAVGGEQENSWDILGTNLSKKIEDQIGHNRFTTEVDRMTSLDSENFDSLGLSKKDLIEAYFQSIFCVVSIDMYANNLFAKELLPRESDQQN